jgi:hypothetical protein
VGEDLHQLHVGLAGGLYGPFPHLVGPLVPGDDVWLHEGGVGLVYVALGELGVSPAGAVAHQLVGEGAGDTSDDEVPDGVLQH